MIVFALIINFISCCVSLHQYDLPVLPFPLPDPLNDTSRLNVSEKKLIPRLIWIAVKDEKDELPVWLSMLS